MSDARTFADWLKMTREAQGYSKNALAQRSGVNRSRMAARGCTGMREKQCVRGFVRMCQAAPRYTEDMNAHAARSEPVAK